MTAILGISAYYHDSAACLVVDGDIVAAAQEERFTRKKHDAHFPTRAIGYCLREASLRLENVDYIAFYEKPLLKFRRLVATYLDHAPSGLFSFLKAMPVWLSEKLWLRRKIETEIAEMTEKVERRRVLFGEHHESHAASAFYPSPFEEAAILTIDGVGEWATSSIAIGQRNEITLLSELRFPHSLGLLYSAFTSFLGFRVNDGEYKVMGLAPYGEPRYVSTIKDHVLQMCEDGSIWLNQEMFDYSVGRVMTSEKFARLFGRPRAPECRLTQREMDMARSIQVVTEEAVSRMASHARRLTGMSALCLAGGVALNCVANARLARELPNGQLWIQPAAGDAGGALGVALAVWHQYLGRPRHVGRPSPSHDDAMKGGLLGPRDSEDAIEAFLVRNGVPFRRFARESIPDIVANLLASQRIVGLHQGRMEFGPRALGNRSILGDPRSPAMQSMMNRKIKFRESFRPFAPSVQAEHAGEWFELEGESPYMLLVAEVRREHRRTLTSEEENSKGLERLYVSRSTIPAVTHVDFTARVQTVRREDNPMFWDILEAFRRMTGCGVVVNTSFNVRDEPIVCTVEDSWRCFMRTALDNLVIETFVLSKAEIHDSLAIESPGIG